MKIFNIGITKKQVEGMKENCRLDIAILKFKYFKIPIEDTLKELQQIK